MSDDLLERATRALREESAPSTDDLAETRARLLASSSNKKARRTSALRWVLPLAAAFAAGTAFAATNGQLERAVQAVQSWLVETPQVATTKPKPRRVVNKEAEQRPPVVEAPLAPQMAEPTKPVEAPSAPAPDEAVAGREPATAREWPGVSGRRPLAREHAATEGPEVEASGSAREQHSPQKSDDLTAEQTTASDTPAQPKPSASPDLALYREAHRMHFVAHDYADALTLWNGYLARFPNGIFALEAGYNRAICLVRLGRTQEASVALRPFAEGQVKGAYRHDEARALLDALNKKP